MYRSTLLKTTLPVMSLVKSRGDEGVEIQLGLLVELAIVPYWTKLTIGLWCKMEG